MHKEIRKIHIKRLLQKFGLAVFHYRGHRRFTDPGFYPEIEAGGRGAVILDVGGNIGQTSVDFRLSFPHASIHSFEPFPATYSLLAEAGKRYGFNTHNIALGHENTTVKVSVDPASSSELNSLVSGYREEGQMVSVEMSVHTLDSWLEANGIDRLDILKVDTEGFDVHVLKGAARALDRKIIGNLIVEVGLAPEDVQHCGMQEIVRILEPYGYRMANLFDVVHGNSPYMVYCNALFRPI